MYPGDVRLHRVLGVSVIGDHGSITKESGRPVGRFLANHQMAAGSYFEVIGLDE